MKSDYSADTSGWHGRRHLILTVCILVFAVLLLVIISGLACDEEGGIISNTNSSKWEFVYISERIAECKDDGNDFSRSALLPWISVLFFPFVMILFEFTFTNVLRGEAKNQWNPWYYMFDGDGSEERANLMPDKQPNQDDGKRNRSNQTKRVTERLLWCDLVHLLAMTLEGLSVGGYICLVYYNHTGTNRNRHGVATGLLFVCCSVLNFMLFGVYIKRLGKWDDVVKIGGYLLLIVAQVASVIAFGVAIGYDWDSKTPVLLEYIVATIWIFTIASNCYIYWVLRHEHLDRSSSFLVWVCVVGVLWVAFVGIGGGVVYEILKRVKQV